MPERDPDMLLERERELAALDAALTTARDGHGRVVVIDGEAGIGKSSLIRTFLRDLPPGTAALIGGCDDLLAPRALAPFHEAVRGRPGPLAAALDGPVDGVVDAVAAELARRPAVLAVEDVHWADDATLDLLRHLARRVHRLPALLVITMRSGAVGADHPAQALVGALTASPGVVTLTLPPLSPAAVAVLAAAAERRAAALHALTGGNPFYVTEALAAEDGTLPDTVADAVAARLRALTPVAVAALEQLAVVPTLVEPALAAALLGDRAEVLADARQRGIVEVRPGGLAFRHEIARRAVEAAVPVLRRRALHREVVRALRALGSADPERLVHHAVAAGDGATIAEVAPLAARQAVLGGSHRQALAHLEAAAAHVHRMDPRTGARVLVEHTWELFMARRFVPAVEAGRAAVTACAATGDVDLELDATLRLCRYLLMCGDAREAEAVLDRAAATLDARAAPPGRAALAVNRGALLLLTGRYAQARPVLLAAVAQAEAVGDPALRSVAGNYHGLAVAEGGDVPAGERTVRAALALALAHGSHEAAARGYTNLADLLHLAGRRDATVAVVAQGRAYCLEHGLDQYLVLLDLFHEAALVRGGAWDEAEPGLRDLRERSRDTPAFVPRVAAHLGRLLARRGRYGAAELVELAWRKALHQGQFIPLLEAGLARAELAWLTGQRPLADEVAGALLPRLTGSAWTPWRAVLERHLARAGVPVRVTGDPDADDVYERALAQAWSAEPAAVAEGFAALEELGATAVTRLLLPRLRERGIRRPGRRAAPEERANPGGLTRRQLDVLDLVGEGATNAEIAARLVLSVRTVDHHVAAILSRAGVRTRRDAVRVLTAAGRH